jgi:uncharacterized protein YdeI (YjbR/CyaY-like superfamily)
VNRQRAAEMIEQGLMTEHGYAAIDLAKAKGTWENTATGDSATIPGDLQEAFARHDAARANFDRFPPSSTRLILEWIASARKPDTRQRRIERTVTLAAMNLRANHPGVRAPDGVR